MPVDFIEEPQALDFQPESGGLDFQPEDTTPGPIGGAVNALRRGVVRAEATLPNLMLPGVANTGPTMRQERRGFERAMNDPRYMEGLIAAGDDPAAMQRTEFLFGPGRRVEEQTAKQKAIRDVWAGVAAEFQKEIQDIPKSQAQQELAAAKSTGDKWGVFRKYPVQTVSSIVLESLPPSMAGAVLGTVAGGPGVGTAAGAGLASAAQEFSGEFLNGAAQAGFDPSDERQLAAFLDSPAFDTSFNKALTRATIIGGVDAVTAGQAGRFVGPALKTGLWNVVKASGKELGMQAAGGAAGEFLGQTATKGEQPYDWFDIAMEAAAELATGPAEAFSNIRQARGISDNPAQAAIEQQLNATPSPTQTPAAGGGTVAPVDFQPAPTRSEPVAEVTPDALAELQAALRGETPDSPRLKGAVKPVQPEKAEPSAERGTGNAETIVIERPAELTEEQRAAIEQVKRQDAEVAKFVENPDKNYEGMGRLELELLEGMGDARATAALRRMRARENVQGPRPNAQGETAPLDTPRPTDLQAVEFLPESASSASAETITGPDERTGSEMPAEAIQPVPPALTSPEVPKKSRPQHSIGDRPWDLIDEIEGQVGGKIDPALIRAANPDWKPIGAARRLFRKGGRAADKVINDLTYTGPKLGLQQDTPLQEFGEMLNAVSTARQGWRGQAKQERTLLDEQAREYETRRQFENKVLEGERPKSAPKDAVAVPIDGLVPGDKFKVQNWNFEVTDIEFDPDDDGRARSVTLKDGPKFGVQTVEGREVIHIDEGTLRKNRKGRAQAGEFGPVEPTVKEYLTTQPERPETSTVQPVDDDLESGRLEEREDQSPTLREKARREKQAEFDAIAAADTLGGKQFDLFSVRSDSRVDRTDGEISALKLFARRLREQLNTPEGVDVTGQVAQNADEVAMLAQVFREPRFEVLHWLFTKQGKVVGRYAVTARIPNATFMWDHGSSFQKLLDYGRAAGADSFWLIHNHPSGDPSPSGADLAATRQTFAAAPSDIRMRGHVIINHRKYSVIDEDGNVFTRNLPQQPGDADPFHADDNGELQNLIGKLADEPYTVAKLARSVADRVQKGAITLVLTDARLRVAAIGEIGFDDFRSESLVREQLRAHGLKQGSSYAFAYYDGEQREDFLDVSAWLVKNSILRDGIYRDQSVAAGSPGRSRVMPINDSWFGKALSQKDAVRIAEGETRYDTDTKRTSLRSQIEALGQEMDAIKSRGETIPEAMLEEYKELVDTLGDEIRSGRATSGAARVQVDDNLQERGTGNGERGTEETPRSALRIPRWKGEERLPGGRLRDLFTGLRRWRERTGNWIARRGERMDITVGRDAADNRAAQSANEASLNVRLVLNRAFDTAPGQVRVKHDVREAALTFVVEADGDRAQLAEFYDQIAASEHADTKAGRQALTALEYAEAHWDKLQPAAERYRVLSETEREAELNEGVNSAEWQGGYVYHRWSKDSPGTGADPTKSTPAGTPFRKSRSVKTYAEGIAAGRSPQTLNALELLAERVAAGQRRMNELSWVHGLRNMMDPVTDEPVVTDVIKKPRKPVNLPKEGSEQAAALEAAGETFKPEWQTIAPEGYTIWRLGDLEVAVQENFASLLTKLTAPSFFKGAKAKKAFGFLKSALLMFDTFHLGRMVAWRQMFGLFGGYQKGQTLLDFTAADIREMAARGEIPEGWAEGLIENKRRLNLAIRTGFNIGNVLDNSWGDALHHLPLIGTFNKWLFGQYQRGAMAEAWLIEFERMSRALPNLNEGQVARRVSQNLNTRFGNLNRQGLFKSRTAQDLARFVFLAPQWNESLIRSELGAIGQALKMPLESVQQRRLVFGTLLRATGLMAVGTFLANQILNYAFRGKPTWDNDEEGWDKKISAWIPDAISGGPGFFLNPLALPMEYTHLIEGNLHRSGGDMSEALRRVLVSRLHAGARPVEIFLNRKDPLGQKLRDGEVLPAMAKALIPVPIGAVAPFTAMQQIVSGEPNEKYPGQFQKQMMASFGVKTDQAPSAEQRIRNLAREFNREKGIVPAAEFFAGDFDDLNKALRIGNMSDAREALEELLKKKTARQVYDHYKRAAAAPFTGQRGRESEFWRGLTAEQRSQYLKARAARKQTALKAAELLRETVKATR